MTASAGDTHALGEILDHMDQAARQDGDVSLGELLEAAGHRSYGVTLLVPGLLLLSPLSGIPVFPSILAIGIFLTAAQLLIGRDCPWLPEWLLGRSFDHGRVRKALGWLRKPVGWIDRISRPRLQVLTRGMARRMVALFCMFLALAMPPLDLVPTANSLSGLTLTLVSLSLVIGDGLFLLAALVVGVGIVTTAALAFA